MITNDEWCRCCINLLVSLTLEIWVNNKIIAIQSGWALAHCKQLEKSPAEIRVTHQQIASSASMFSAVAPAPCDWTPAFFISRKLDIRKHWAPQAKMGSFTVGTETTPSLSSFPGIPWNESSVHYSRLSSHWSSTKLIGLGEETYRTCGATDSFQNFHSLSSPALPHLTSSRVFRNRGTWWEAAACIMVYPISTLATLLKRSSTVYK